MLGRQKMSRTENSRHQSNVSTLLRSITTHRVPAVARHCRQLAIILKSGDYFFQKARKNAIKIFKIFDVAIKNAFGYNFGY